MDDRERGAFWGGDPAGQRELVCVSVSVSQQRSADSVGFRAKVPRCYVCMFHI